MRHTARLIKFVSYGFLLYALRDVIAILIRLKLLLLVVVHFHHQIMTFSCFFVCCPTMFTWVRSTRANHARSADQRCAYMHPNARGTRTVSFRQIA